MPSFVSPYAVAQLQDHQAFYYPPHYAPYHPHYKYYHAHPASSSLPAAHPLPPLSRLLPPQQQQQPSQPHLDHNHLYALEQQQQQQQQPPPATHPSPQKVFAFVSLPGVNQKKRPRRKYHEIERLYHCNFQGCLKSYGTLNHLNAHVSMQQHGPKRHPSEFKELRKQWRKQKRDQQKS